ncbi:MAG: superoxide dismutase family protein [bacterium]|nr:superoxide dismutase family protein [bacterium]
MLEFIVFTFLLLTDYDGEAELINKDGNVVGKALLKETPHGVLIYVDATGLPSSSELAFHIHEKGLCEPPDFQTAGGHFNPEKKKHGFLNKDGYHAGDMPNFFTDKEGRARFHVLNTKVTMKEARPNSILGLSLMIHVHRDDYVTDPAGGAGHRIACGLIKRSEKKGKQ